MTFLYSQFLKVYMLKEIQMVTTTDIPADEFKLALISQDAIDAQKASPSGAGDFTKNSCLATFSMLQEQGAEVQSLNYEPGGKAIEFTKTYSNFNPEVDEKYSDGLPRIFYDLNRSVNFGTASEPVQFTTGGAIIYRVSDGLLMAYYQFADPVEVDGTFSLTWGGQHVLSVKSDIYNTEEGSSVSTIDTELSTTSNNPVSNKAITQALLNLGTRLGLKVKDSQNNDDDITDAGQAIYSSGSLDELNSLSQEQLTDIFNAAIREISEG